MRTACTQCGTCLEHCPVYQMIREEQASPKAKHLILDAVEREGALSWEKTLRLTRLCAGCGRCADVCPLNLSVAETLAQSRSRHPDWTAMAWKLWIQASSLAWPMAGLAAKALPGAAVPAGLRPLVLSAKAMKAGYHPRPWLRFAGRGKEKAETVALFSGCAAKAVRPEWVERARALLKMAGFTVARQDEDFGCCGETLRHAGLLDAADTLRANNIRLWNAMGRPRIAVFCASCQHGLESYPATLFVDEAEAAFWKKSITPLSALLLEDAGESPVFVADQEKTPNHIVYHKPCHRKGTDTDLALLRGALPSLPTGKALCCGMGGVLKLTHAKMSSHLAEKCWEGLAPEDGSGPVEALSGCSGCVLQLAAFAGSNSARHWLDAVIMPTNDKPE